jgi:hypothetical protein
MDADAVGGSSAGGYRSTDARGLPACSGQPDQSPLSVSSCRSHSGSCTRSRKCQVSPHAPQTTVFPSASVWPPAVRRNSSLSRREVVCWQWWQVVRLIFFKILRLDGCSN